MPILINQASFNWIWHAAWQTLYAITITHADSDDTIHTPSYSRHSWIWHAAWQTLCAITITHADSDDTIHTPSCFCLRSEVTLKGSTLMRSQMLQSALASEAAAVAAARSQQVCAYADHSRCICECLCVAVCTCQ